MTKLCSDFEVLGNALIIRDLNLGRMSVTNDAENVVAHLRDAGLLKNDQQLFYLDSSNRLGELIWNEDIWNKDVRIEFKVIETELA